MSTTPGRDRLPRPSRNELDSESVQVYDKIVGGPRGSAAGRKTVVDDAGRLLGPFNAMLVSPGVGDALQQLGAAIRYQTSLADRVRELAIVTVAAYRNSAFEWHAHAPLARDAGLTDLDLETIRGGAVDSDDDVVGEGGSDDEGDTDTNDDAATLGAADHLVVRAVRSLLQERDLDDRLFAALQAHLGVTGVVELVTLVGYYDLLASSMQVFRVGLPDSAQPEV